MARLHEAVTEWAEAGLTSCKAAELHARLLDQIEPPLLVATLVYADGNQSTAARILGLSRITLRKKLQRHNIRVNL